ncbi:stage II sporulation protein R [Cohnella hongkongensis]|uniref:Stage II sporulation protein R n=1 Tax=Cohnella hongkongensis TaxID=178337 RepID=A0ABV9FCT0_9BACL
MRNRHHSFFYDSATKMVLLIAVLGLGLFAGGARFAAAGNGETIPEDAIRIRIIANSDSRADQAIKNQVRDEVAAHIASWGGMPDTHDEAYALIESRLADIQRVVDEQLDELGAAYEGTAELGEVPFPERTFEGSSYEAGNYEALRITLGKGTGTNWWCVLFPPLCLTAAVAQEDAGATTDARSASSGGASSGAGDDEPKAKFFLWELLEKLFAFLGSLFG